MKKTLKRYLSLTPAEKLNRLRYLRKNADFFCNDIIAYYDFENFSIRELNGNEIIKVSEQRSEKEKELILRNIYFSDDFNFTGVINRGFNQADYFYLNPSDFKIFNLNDKKDIDYIEYILNKI